MTTQLVSVTHRYGSTTALRNISWKLQPGVTGLIGVNGAGKTTLLRILAAQLRPTEGAVELLGRSVSDRSVKREIGVMPQSVELPREIGVRTFLTYMSWLRGIKRADRRDAVDEALEQVDLGGSSTSRIGALSGGMYRRLLFAQAILAKPRLLLLDEPTAGLDPEQRVRLRNLVAGFDWVEAMVISSHLMEDLVPIADHMLMLDGGMVAFAGSVDELGALGRTVSSEPMNAFESAFLSLRLRGGP